MQLEMPRTGLPHSQASELGVLSSDESDDDTIGMPGIAAVLADADRIVRQVNLSSVTCFKQASE